IVLCARPSGTRSVGYAYPALPCRALDCSVPSGLGPCFDKLVQNIRQSLSWNAPSKSPVGTTGTAADTWSWMHECGDVSNAEYLAGNAWDCPVTFSRPFGTCRFSNLYPGLRPGLSSAVPAGLNS